MSNPSQVRLILASNSAGRKYLLSQAGFQFEIKPSNVDEPTSAPDPRTLVHSAAWLKVAAIAAHSSDGLILGADTVGWIDGKPLLKPRDQHDARRMLRSMAGRDHELWTGVVLWRKSDDTQITWQEKSIVRLAPMSENDLDHYFSTRSWHGHCGAYAIREENDPLVQVVAGSVSNVIGLPMESLTRHLHWLGFPTPPKPPEL